MIRSIRNWLFTRNRRRVCASTAASELASHGARQRKEAWIALRNEKTEQLKREVAALIFYRREAN